MSGDATLSNTGVLAIANNAITGPELAASSVAISKISATGTASATTYLRGDGSWQTVSGGDDLGAGGTTTGTLYSQNGSGYGYFGSSSANYFRFDDAAVGNELFIRLNNDWRYYLTETALQPYTDNVNDLGSSSRGWRDVWTHDVHTDRICNSSGSSCVNQSALGSGGGSAPAGTWCGRRFAQGTSSWGSVTYPANPDGGGSWSCNGTAITISTGGAIGCPAGYAGQLLSFTPAAWPSNLNSGVLVCVKT